MATDIETFFDIYVRPHGGRIDRRGFAARYAAAALLVACSRADADQDPEEDRVIAEILSSTFELSQRTVDQIMRLIDQAEADGQTLETVTDLVREYYAVGDRRSLLKDIWRVAYADGRIDVYEERFIDRVASLLELTENDVVEARAIAETFSSPPA